MEEKIAFTCTKVSMKKQNLTFIYGGPSEEHEVSVKSFENIWNEASKNENLILKKIFIDKCVG